MEGRIEITANSINAGASASANVVLKTGAGNYSGQFSGTVEP
jgi:hypothetical protein